MNIQRRDEQQESREEMIGIRVDVRFDIGETSRSGQLNGPEQRPFQRATFTRVLCNESEFA